MPWAPIAAAGIGGVASILGGALAGRSKTYTQTSTPTWSPEMASLRDRLSSYSQSLMDNPEQGIAPIQAAAQERINRRYAAMPDAISRQMAARGYGSSGNFGNTMYQTAYARSGEMSDLQGQIANLILQQKAQGASLSEQLLNLTRGTTTTGNTPSMAAPDALMSSGNALNNIATLMTLSKLMKTGTTPTPGFTPYASASSVYSPSSYTAPLPTFPINYTGAPGYSGDGTIPGLG